MKLMIRLAAVALMTTRLAAAQTPEEARVSVDAFELAANGAEKPAGVTFTTGPLKIGHAATASFSVRPCGYFSLNAGPPYAFAENAIAGWRIELTPLRVVEHAVTFRLRWMRGLDPQGGFEPTREDVELTLKPGESRPIDSVPVPLAGAKTFDGRACTTKAASLRVSVDFPDLDRRLVGAELWLVEHLPDGKERSQTLSIRGLFNRAIPFYFDSVNDGSKRIDIFGKLVFDAARGGFDVSVEAIRAAANPDPEWGYWAARWFRSTVSMKPNEVIDIALPPSDEKTRSPGEPSYSIRIKPKQIR